MDINSALVVVFVDGGPKTTCRLFVLLGELGGSDSLLVAALDKALVADELGVNLLKELR
jgi:hypothetical protein